MREKRDIAAGRLLHRGAPRAAEAAAQVVIMPHRMKVKVTVNFHVTDESAFIKAAQEVAAEIHEKVKEDDPSANPDLYTVEDVGDAGLWLVEQPWQDNGFPA